MKAVLLCLVTVSFAYAQEYPHHDVDLSHLSDEIFAMQDGDINYEELQETIAQILLHPIDLNRATEEELRFLSILNEEQIQNLLSYRQDQGFLLSIYELQAIPGFDQEVIYRIVPFVKVQDQERSFRGLWDRLLSEKNNYLTLRYDRSLESPKGFQDTTDSRFTGSRDKVHVRFRVSRPHDFSIGFSAEKDAGEKIAWNTKQNQLGFDFWSGHIAIQNKGTIKNLILGDFQAQFGQGLILGGSFGTGKGAETVMSVRRNSIGFVPYTSSNESIFNRGIATTLKLGRKIFLSGFYSSVFQDGTLMTDSINATTRSIQASGLHRTTKEIDNENNIHEQQTGAVVSIKKKDFEAGLIYHRLWYNASVEPSPTLYNQFEFRGKVLQNISAFINYNYANFTFFSEGALTLDHGRAMVAGAIGSLGRSVDVSFLYRNYARHFHSFNTNAFAENSSPKNEQGIYWGWKCKLSRKYFIASYIDIFRFPWLRFRSYSPANGHEYLVRFNYQPTKQIIMFAQFREEEKQRNTSADDQLYSTTNVLKRNYWLCADYVVSENLKMKTRIQYSTLKSEKVISDGFVITHDASISYGKWQCTARYALFQSGDFDNRQYVFENDVWLAYSLQAYYGTGVRNYVLLEYKLNKHVSLWAKWSCTRYSNQEKIGSGADEITGNKRNDVKFQVRIRL